MRMRTRLTLIRRRGRGRHHRQSLKETLDRHPVSLTRQRGGTALFVVMMLGLVAYYVSTQDAAIERRATHYLREVTSGEVTVGSARFSMFGGITLKDVCVSVPYSEALDASAVDAASREIFSASSLTLIHSPWRLLIGDFRIERIVVTEPEITIVHNIDTGERNWRLLLGKEAPSQPSGPANRPRITIRSARVVSIAIGADGPRKDPPVELDADVRPHGQIDSAYCIEVRRLRPTADRTMVVLSPEERLLTNSPFVDVKTVGRQLPKAYQRLFDAIRLEGEVKLSRIRYGAKADGKRDDAVELRDVRCAIPLSMLLSDRGIVSDGRGDLAVDDPDDPPITMTDVNGRLVLRGSDLVVEIAGRINGATCRINGTLAGIDGDLSELGIEIELGCDLFAMPEAPWRDRVLSDGRVPEGLRRFFHDYDPRGRFDIDGKLIRPPGKSGRVRFEGLLRPRRASASYHGFPYRVEGLRGQVRFEEGRIHLEHLRGRHGPAAIEINGTIDRTRRYADVDVEIEGTAVPLDLDLFQALSARYREIWKRFDPRGLARVHLHLRRPGADATDPRPAWNNTVTAELIDGQIAFEQFPYPLDHVHGRIRVASGLIRLIGLTARRGEATVRIDGYASITPGAPDMELRVEARSLPLDDTLAAALPEHGRAAFAQFRPEGHVDLLGTVSLHEGDEGVRYDLRADLVDARIRYEQLPYDIDGIHGRLHIRPDNVVIVDFQGRHGPARIAGRGTVRRKAGEFVVDLTFDCRDVNLDRQLYRALPGRVRSVWDQFEPAGKGRIKTHIHYVAGATPQAVRYRTEIEIEDGSLRFSGFPMPLTSVYAKLLVSDRKAEVLSLSARAGGGSIVVSGTMDLETPGRRGTFQVDARNVQIDEALLQAVPETAARLLAAARPSGRIDLFLRTLRFETDAHGRRRWDFAGRLELKDAGARLGIKFSKVNGVVSGRGAVDPSGAWELDAHADLDSATLIRWPLERLEARIVRLAGSNILSIEDASAEIFGGTSTGSAEIEFGGLRTDYRVSLTARDAQLDRYIAAMSESGRSGKEDKPAQGSVYGNLALRGRTGRNGFMEGGGELFVREAQVWKLPLVWLIFQVLNLTPDENVFHDGWIEFFFTRDKLTFQRIDLQGKALSFVGAGRMELKTGQLDVTLLAGSPVRIRVPFLTDILEGASRELMEVRVTGTASKPNIVPKPLKSLRKALETLFPESSPRPATQAPATPDK